MKYDKKVIHRLNRIEGQIRGILKMMDEQKDCREVVTQMSAARNALDRTAALIVSDNLEKCIRNEQKNGEDSERLIKEAVQLLVKSR
ncbi:MAG TPA: metal-sensitive transcriptional regulator [Candidatus Avamphibacillus intestinigallinarum]|nr:metal-sensitive transcriptional regulator [Candidatus Avamphibacillus intestinigallinarum]